MRDLLMMNLINKKVLDKISFIFILVSLLFLITLPLNDPKIKLTLNLLGGALCLASLFVYISLSEKGMLKFKTSFWAIVDTIICTTYLAWSIFNISNLLSDWFYSFFTLPLILYFFGLRNFLYISVKPEKPEDKKD